MTMTMDQAIDRLYYADDIPGEAIKRICMVRNSQDELFAAATHIMVWLSWLPVKDRPIAAFNRLMDALNGVREAHQMDEV